MSAIHVWTELLSSEAFLHGLYVTAFSLSLPKVLPLKLCPHFLSLEVHWSYLIKVYPSVLILISLSPYGPFLQAESHSEVPGVRTSTCELWEDRFQLVTGGDNTFG